MSHADVQTLVNEIRQLREQLQSQERPLTLQEAAQYLNLSKSRLYVLTSTAQIPHFKPSKKIFFQRKDLDAYLLQNRINSRQEAASQAA